MTASPPFDPFAQTFTLNTLDGPTPPITDAIVNDYVGYGIKISVQYATQVGASFMLFTILMMTTRRDKRVSPIFALNMSSLLLDFVRNILQILYFTGPWYDFYAAMLEDYSRVPAGEYAISVAGDALTLLLVACVEASLVLQVRAVCVTLRERNRSALILAATAIALAAVGVRFALTVQNSRAILGALWFDSGHSIAQATAIMEATSICFFSAIFVGKLGATLLQRRKMGIKQFGPMQIVFIMGCQTLIIPAMFSILQNFRTLPEIGSWTLTLTVLFLPMSSLWASANTANKTAADSSAGRVGPFIGGGGGGGGSNGSKKHLLRSFTTTNSSSKAGHTNTATSTTISDSPTKTSWADDCLAGVSGRFKQATHLVGGLDVEGGSHHNKCTEDHEMGQRLGGHLPGVATSRGAVTSSPITPVAPGGDEFYTVALPDIGKEEQGASSGGGKGGIVVGVSMTRSVRVDKESGNGV